MSTFTKTQKSLLRRYSCEISVVELFLKLRKEEKISLLSDERLLWCIYASTDKSFEESLENALLYQKLLEDYKDFFPDDFEFSDKLYHTNPYFQKLTDREVFFLDDGVSKNGCGLYMSDYGHWVPIVDEGEAKQAVAFFFHLFEDLLRKRPENVKNGVIFICNFENFGWSNFDLNTTKLGASAFLNFHWKLVKKVVLLNTPWYISWVVNLCQPFFNSEIMSRVVCLGTKEELIEGFVDEENLIEQWGGKKIFDYQDWIEKDYAIKSKKEKFHYITRSELKKKKKKKYDDDEKEDKVSEEERKEMRKSYEKFQKMADDQSSKNQ